jgi:probable phosphomutase (TIGR03848 family)
MRVVLIRHAHSQANALGVLSGRRPNVHLSKLGAEQSIDLARRLGDFIPYEIRVSPMERCHETIKPWLSEKTDSKRGKPKPIIDQGLTEVDYGDWSGKKLSVLSRNKLWSIVQNTPSQMYFPKGEGILQMQSRAMETIHANAKRSKEGTLVIVSHGDVIKSIVASALGMHLDEFQRIIIDPASVSVIDFSTDKPRVLLLNDTRAVVTELLTSKKRSKYQLGGGNGK